MKEKDFTVILQRYLENKCTKAEFELITRVLEGETAEDQRWADLIFQYLTKDDSDSVKEAEVTPELQRLLNEVFSNVLTHINTTEPSYLRVQWNYFRRVAAIAAILFMMFTGIRIYWFETDNNSNPEQTSIVEQKIVPGGNKAVLTLSDGKTIALSNLAMGTIAKQGNVVINKTKGGRLIYQIKGADQNIIESFNTISTPKGGQFQIDLPDGTKVWLNAESSLRYPTRFNKQERKVELHGEAYFEVKADKSWPFRLISRNQELEVLGTRFNVSNYPDESHVTTTLVKGSVRLQVAGSAKKQVTLKPNEQSRLSSQDITVDAVDAADVVAWKDGLFKFDHDDLENTMKKICRWYDVGIVYEREDLKKINFMGSISRYESVSDVLNIISQTGSVRFDVIDRVIYVKPPLRSRIRPVTRQQQQSK